MDCRTSGWIQRRVRALVPFGAHRPASLRRVVRREADSALCGLCGLCGEPNLRRSSTAGNAKSAETEPWERVAVAAGSGFGCRTGAGPMTRSAVTLLFHLNALDALVVMAQFVVGRQRTHLEVSKCT
jgi:hypothetical protein